MFARFVYALLVFCAHEFPVESETKEPREIIAYCTSYVGQSITYMITLNYFNVH